MLLRIIYARFLLKIACVYSLRLFYGDIQNNLDTQHNLWKTNYKSVLITIKNFKSNETVVRHGFHYNF